jgi:cytochrome c biogenesis protein CcdA
MNSYLGLSGILAVFGAGLLASLSPCVYPLLPITVGFIGTQAQGKKTFAVVSYATGQIAAFVALGAFTVFAGETFGFSSESRTLNSLVALVLFLSGIVSFQGKFPDRLTAFFSKPFSKSRKLPGEARGGLISAFGLGAGSALVASPCTSPILAGVLATMASSATVGRGLLLMFFYALGFSSLFLTLGLGLTKIPKSGMWLGFVHKASAVLLIVASAYYLKRAISG